MKNSKDYVSIQIVGVEKEIENNKEGYYIDYTKDGGIIAYLTKKEFNEQKYYPIDKVPYGIAWELIKNYNYGMKLPEWNNKFLKILNTPSGKISVLKRNDLSYCIPYTVENNDCMREDWQLVLI